MMECNAIRQAVCVNETVFDSTAEVPLETDITLPDYCPDIVRILKCSLNSCVKSTHLQGRQLTIEGVCSVCVLYLGEETAGGELRLRSISYKLPYTKSVELKGDATQVIAFVCSGSSYCNCRAVSKRRIELRASVEHRICAVSSGEAEVITDAADDTENPSGIQLHRSSLSQTGFVTQARDLLDIQEELELANGKPPIRSILCSHACAVVLDQKLISGKIVTKGELRITVLYAADSSGGTKAEEMYYTLPISGVIDAPGADDSCICSLGYAVCEYEISPKSDAQGENTLLELRAQVAVSAEVCRRMELAVADDCYSTRYACESQTRPFSFLSLVETVEERCLYKGEVELPAEIQTILNGWATVSDSSLRFEEENGSRKAVLQIDLDICLLAQEADGSIQFYDKTEQMECSFPLSGVDAQAKLIFCPQISVIGFDYSRGASSLQVRCEVLVRGCISQLCRCSVMEQITVDEAKPIQREDDYSLTIYYADPGETLWDIAKRYHTGMQSVMEANAQIELSEDSSISGREMLLIPILPN